MEDKKRSADDAPEEHEAKRPCCKSEESLEGCVELAEPTKARQHQELLPPPTVEDALATAFKACGAELKLGMRLEVSWEIVDDSADAEEANKDGETVASEPNDSVETAEPEHVWWECQMTELVGLHPEFGPVWKLVYDAKTVVDKEFPWEERKVSFCGKNMLIDLDSHEKGVGGGDVGLMQWRLEGCTDELPPLLPVGQSVKARFKGGDQWYAGKIAALNQDGTYAVHYADMDEELHVHRDLIEVVEDDAADEVDDTPVIAESIDDFFEIFTAQLMQGDVFRRLDPDKQRVAAEKMAEMRPLFREELEKLMESRGKGTTVTADDIKDMLPRVMSRGRELQSNIAAARRELEGF